MSALLTPAILLAQILPPAADVSGGKILLTTNELILRFVFALLAPATLVGALEGWALAHSWQGAAIMALAGLLFALGLGHNVPFLGRTPVVDKEVVLLAATTLASSVALVKTHEWLARYQARQEELRAKRKETDLEKLGAVNAWTGRTLHESHAGASCPDDGRIGCDAERDG
jgi:hypothetical protein